MAGSPLGNQAVLLAGVNDDINVMKELNMKLLSMGVKPYYIYLCDPVAFTAHFRTPVEKALEIIDNLRGHTSGFATPQLVIDAPQGGGKTLIPNGIVGRHVGKEYTVWKIINFEKVFYYYLAPNDLSGYYRRYNKPVPPDFDLNDAKDSHLKEALEKKLIH
jgi:lysine 2,3-aminomutase